MSGLRFIASMVAMLHVAALSFVVGPWHWKYLLVTVVRAGILWILLPLLLPLRRWTGPLMQFASSTLSLDSALAALVVVHPLSSGVAPWSISADEIHHHEIEN